MSISHCSGTPVTDRNRRDAASRMQEHFKSSCFTKRSQAGRCRIAWRWARGLVAVHDWTLLGMAWLLQG